MSVIRIADLFCGAGGTSTGAVSAVESLGMRAELTAINHWDRAVETHSSNHPEARHLCASLDSLNPRDLYKPGQLDVLWASPECTHHSIARGGKPISEQSRAFLTWGPIGSSGRPLKSKSGETFGAWVKCLESLGYRVAWRVLCAADYGDPTTRRRLFVYAVIGLHKYSLRAFIIGAGGPDRTAEPQHIDDPLKTILCKEQHYGSSGATSVDEPVDTVTTRDRFGLVQPTIELQGERYVLDIHFRVLRPHELARAQGFPSSYKFAGNISEIVKQIGNAVPAGLARALVKAALTLKGDVS